MGIVGRLDQYGSMLTGEFDDYSMSENLLTYSEQFNNAVWSKANTSVSANATIAPDGFSTADNVSNTPSVNSYISQFKSLSTNTTYTFSLYAKPITTSFIAVEWGNPNPSFLVGNFTLNTLSFSGSGSGTITALSNGWYRITHTITTGATATPSFNVIYIGAYGSTPSNVSIAFWGAQLEVGSTATDYTPTTTTAKNRVLSSATNTNITGFSTYFGSGFSENVGAATTLTANVFPPYQIVYDEFAGTLFGSGQGRLMRQNTDKSVIVYNEIDEVTDFYSRGVIRAGLVLDLDAGIDSSYSGTGTTWTDLSPYGNNGTLILGPTFSSIDGGSIVFDGNNDSVTVSYNSILDITTSISLEAWIYPTKNSGIQNVICKSSSSSNNSYIYPRTDDGWTNSVFYLNIGGSFSTLSTPWPSINAWHHTVATYDGNFMRIYINGSLSNSKVQTGTITTNSNLLTIGNQPIFSEYYGGRISSSKIYNRALTSKEVLQNYNALKHRFGL